MLLACRHDIGFLVSSIHFGPRILSLAYAPYACLMALEAIEPVGYDRATRLIQLPVHFGHLGPTPNKVHTHGREN